MDNTVRFKIFNSSFPVSEIWPENLFSSNLPKKRKQRSMQFEKEKKQNLARRELQRTILLLLIDAKRQPEPIAEIAKHIGKSKAVTRKFLCKHDDRLWVEFQGDQSRWWTSLKVLPDRLFY